MGEIGMPTLDDGAGMGVMGRWVLQNARIMSDWVAVPLCGRCASCHKTKR